MVVASDRGDSKGSDCSQPQQGGEAADDLVLDWSTWVGMGEYRCALVGMLGTCISDSDAGFGSGRQLAEV